MNEPEFCPLCARPIPSGEGSRHHLVPKRFKSLNRLNGCEIVTLHRICHRKIHSLFTDKDLAKKYNTIEALKSDREVSSFIEWLASKPPAFYSPTATSDRKRCTKR
ncbi:MAG: HNH endonuclease [Kiloniellales bacterium]|nr:HNH endonuclease [Kiloniellales bacterium]